MPVDHVFVRAGPWRFMQPSLFEPPFPGFNVEPGLLAARWTMDVVAPRGSSASS